MQDTWRDDQPIYKQLKERVVSLILAEEFKAGESLPSVRQVSSDYKINHITVSKAYQELVDEGLVEKRRGLGMFVLDGAKEGLLSREQERFAKEELPAFLERIKQLGISKEILVEMIEKTEEH